MQYPGTRQAQQGAILVVSIVLLLVMSIIGLSAVVSSTLQEKMAFNAQQKTLSRYNAESAIRTAEDWLSANVQSQLSVAQFNGANGLYSEFAIVGLTQQVPLSDDINDVSNAALWSNANSIEVNVLSTNVQARNPRYAIEFMGRDKGTAGTTVTLPDDNRVTAYPFIFRITAIGFARDTNVYSVLQSYYRTGYGPGVFTYDD